MPINEYSTALVTCRASGILGFEDCIQLTLLKGRVWDSSTDSGDYCEQVVQCVKTRVRFTMIACAACLKLTIGSVTWVPQRIV